MTARHHDASFTEVVRQELARLPVGSDAAVRAELSALLRVAGRISVRGGDPPSVDLELTTTSGAVARRAYVLLGHRFGLRPDLMVRAPGGVRRTTSYGVRVTAGAGTVARDLGLVDQAGRPVEEPPTNLSAQAAVAYVRGALLGAGSISSPGRPPHLEIAVSSSAAGRALARLVERAAGGHAVATDEAHVRVVVKSGATIGDVLAAVGASQAFLLWDDRRLRRQLRSDANRLANADAANLRRTIAAAALQVEAVETAIRRVGWDGLDDDLRPVALARLANPTASIGELAELLDPPVGKSAVHRRLRRIGELAVGPTGPTDR